MKDWTLSAVTVAALALVLGLLFHWVYPTVEPSAELGGLFTFVALALKLVVGKLVALLRPARRPAGPEQRS